MTPINQMKWRLGMILALIIIGGGWGGSILYTRYQQLEGLQQDCASKSQQRYLIEKTSQTLDLLYQGDPSLRESFLSLKKGGIERIIISKKLSDLFSATPHLQLSFGAATQVTDSVFCQLVTASFDFEDDRDILNTLSKVERLPGLWFIEKVSLERVGSLLKGEIQWRWLSSHQPLLP